MAYIKKINIKSRTCYFFDDIIIIKGFDSNLLKLDTKSYKNIDIYYIGFITIKDSDYVKINSVKPFYLIIVKVNGCFEENNGNKYLTLASRDKNKEVLKKYTELQKIQFR